MGQFEKNTSLLIIGNIIAQSLTIAAMPILTRLYSPSEFGIFALFIAVFSVLSSVATGRYELAIMSPASDIEAKKITLLSMYIAVLVAIIFSLLLLIFNENLSALFNNHEIVKWLYFLPIMMASFGIYQSIDYYLNRSKNYKMMAKNKAAQSGSIALLQGLMFFLTKSGLILGSVVGWIFSVVFIFKRSGFSFEKLKLNDAIELAGKYKQYSLLQAPFGFLNSISAQAPTIAIIRLFEFTIGGLYSLCVRVLSAPLMLISKSLGQVFFQHISEAARSSPSSVLSELYKTVIKLFILALPVFIPIFLFAPEAFSYVFGKDWLEAGVYAQTLVFAMAIKFIVSPLSVIFLAINKIKTGSIWQGCYFISTMLMLLTVMLLSVNFENFLQIYVVHEVIWYIVYFVMMVKSVKLFAGQS